MSQSDRLYLEDLNPTLVAKLTSVLCGATPLGDALHPQDVQDFEVTYYLRTDVDQSGSKTLSLDVRYPFLGPLLQEGSQELLEGMWGSMPVRLRTEELGTGSLGVDLDLTAAWQQDEATRKTYLVLLASVRQYLLTGPLWQRLCRLRDAAANAKEAARAAPPGAAREAESAALAAAPQAAPAVLQVRHNETIWIVPKSDRVLVILGVQLDDDVDVTLGRAFCQEFAETNRGNTSNWQPPCSFNESKDMPTELRALPSAAVPNVGYLMLTLSDQQVLGANQERLLALARPVMNFRNFFLFHLKHAKSYLHSRLRKRLHGWETQLNLARRTKRGQEKRRLASGKEFVRKDGQ
eukprot:TRINITY_DN65675_c0_g1_i1.p1 TRINITY_DN65675_c0_g1~~TRINITY_DN65675_c0_g1_i1.p1  ORF type:complete len:375 (-),score=67.64 TRINITY_DN65675_c0_g1_i1:45-1094(-)